MMVIRDEEYKKMSDHDLDNEKQKQKLAQTAVVTKNYGHAVQSR
jgi:hypothetical protein